MLKNFLINRLGLDLYLRIKSEIIHIIKSLYLINPAKKNIQLEIDNFLKNDFSDENPYFVEAGAADGIIYSNSYILEKKLGWNGLLIEPLPRYYKKIKKFRRCSAENFALIDNHDIKTIELLDYGVRSDIQDTELQNTFANDRERQNVKNSYKVTGNKIIVKTAIIGELLLLHSISKVSIMFIDVEGYELKLLKGLKNWKGGTINLLIIETINIDLVTNLIKNFAVFANVKHLGKSDYSISQIKIL